MITLCANVLVPLCFLTLRYFIRLKVDSNLNKDQSMLPNAESILADKRIISSFSEFWVPVIVVFFLSMPPTWDVELV